MAPDVMHSRELCLQLLSRVAVAVAALTQFAVISS